ncbi:translocation/assembly module TamB domain-containing protein [Pseudomonas sp. CCI3.1]|uniref:translocation/assembly module TamB domain-containing protein n=1 Tax=Pseudomonas sp. CCI3.1 TaxID=3048618 RepID=UPI002AB36229|nr:MULTISPECIES: translocation/assembly module TamB domain-containing protein [unclassified Pseudomonas]MDY7581566.1 translocation/assembly module TamB domain-containing protein [Pseudomonas sp. CCI3.1]MEB0067463.1 translocation/assembly module TamB domain-containing protein [Pseudomonas sp. CCI3.1]MEB0070414.1 translocation/assembly module TamB domain-containing protein [Pseudomonas sp. CCI1.4]
MIRGLKIAGLVVLALVLLVVVSVGVMLGTQTGSRWVLGQVPGLQVDNFAGRLGGQWGADHLLWEQGTSRVEVDRPIFAWSPGCLTRMTLCIDQLQAEKVSLQFPPSEDSSSGPISLPELKLPLAIEVGVIKVGNVLFNGIEQLKGMQMSAQWTAKGLQIDSVKVEREDLNVELSGLLQPNGDWPLTLQGNVSLPAPGDKPLAVALKVEGNLRTTLNLAADTSGYLTAHLTGEIQPLADNLPAQLKITAEPFKASPDLPDTLVLNQLLLTAKGDLKDGYELNGSATLPAEQEPVSLLLKGRVDAKGAQIAALDLTANPKQHLKLSGQVDWQEGLSAEAKIDWLEFPWHNLYPLIDKPDVDVRTFVGEVSYRDGNYLGNFQANLDGPAGKFSLSSPFSGDLGKIFLPQLKLVAGQGKAEGHVNVQFADGVAWDTALDLSAINPAYWVAELPGTLAGPLRSKGSFKTERLELDANLDLKGRLRGLPAVLQAKANGAGETWTVSALDIRLGDNRINGTATLQQQIKAQLDLNMPRLGQLWPELRGQLKGRVDLGGTLKAPQGTVKLNGQQLAFADNRLQNLTLDASLDRNQRGRLDLKGSGIQAGETQLGVLTANASGDIKRQQLKLGLQGPMLQLALALDGGLDKDNWRGRLVSGDVKAGGQAWVLQNPARLERLADGRINMGSQCWISGPASLCSEEQRLMPDPRLRLHLKQFPLDSLAEWLPKDFQWQGDLNADLVLDLPASGPKGQIVVDASGGTLLFKDKGQWVDFPYEAFKLTSNLTPNRVESRLDFDGGKLGQLMLSARINPLPKSKPISGEFQLTGLDVSMIRPFAPMVEKLTGQLNGSGTISGVLLSPHIIGNVALSDGEISGPQLPTNFENVQLSMAINGETALINGGWTSGQQGQGSISGNVAWGRAMVVDVLIKGNNLPVTVEPYAKLEVAPDLKISLNPDNTLLIAGRVNVPKGEIVVRELPPSTVKVSDDTVVVGQQTTDEASPMQIDMDINVVVGQELLTFSGFGLSADLAGQVHIGNNLETRGELRLNNGRYRAYGQKLTIRRARLLFAGPIDQPYLDIEAVRQTDDVIAGIRLTGSAEQPTTQIFSEPAMSQEQALSYLILGRPLTGTGEDENLLAQAALGLGLLGSSGITTSLANHLGLKEFELDTEGSGNNTSVVASGKINERLSVRYGVGVFEPASTIALRYKLSKRVYVEVASGFASSLDIFYKRDF